MYISPDFAENFNKGSYQSALRILGDEWGRNKNQFGSESNIAVQMQIKYAEMYHMVGDYREANRMYRDILEVMEKNPDKHKKDLFHVKLSLALFHRKPIGNDTNTIEEIETYIAHMPAGYDKIKLKKKLATTMRDLGVYEKASFLFNQIHDDINGHLPKLDVLSNRSDLATVFLQQGSYKKALDIFQEVYEQAKQIDGKDPCTLLTQRCIGDIYMHQGLYNFAAEKYKAVGQIQSSEKPRTLETLTTWYKYSQAVLKDGKPGEAVEKLEEICGVLITEIPKHPVTIKVQMDIITISFVLENYSKLFIYLQRMLENVSDVFRYAHNLTSNLHLHAASFFRKLDDQSKASKALDIYMLLYDIQRNKMGNEHRETLQTKKYIAETLFYLKNYDEALKHFLEIIRIKIEQLRYDPMDCMHIYKQTAEIYRIKNQYETAFDYFSLVYQNERKFLGSAHSKTGYTENILKKIDIKQPRFNLIKAILFEDLQSVTNICNETENAYVNVQDSFGYTPLHVASNLVLKEIYKFLISKGANPSIINKYGRTPTHLAEGKFDKLSP